MFLRILLIKNGKTKRQIFSLVIAAGVGLYTVGTDAVIADSIGLAVGAATLGTYIGYKGTRHVVHKKIRGESLPLRYKPN